MDKAEYSNSNMTCNDSITSSKSWIGDSPWGDYVDDETYIPSFEVITSLSPDIDVVKLKTDDVYCDWCNKELKEKEYAVKSNSHYYHIDCFKDYINHLIERLDEKKGKILADKL